MRSRMLATSNTLYMHIHAAALPVAPVRFSMYASAIAAVAIISAFVLVGLDDASGLHLMFDVCNTDSLAKIGRAGADHAIPDILAPSCNTAYLPLGADSMYKSWPIFAAQDAYGQTPGVTTAATYTPFIHIAESVDIIDDSGSTAPDIGSDDAFGASVANIGDLDRDGVSDMAVGAPADGKGAVYILLMNDDGTIKQVAEKIEDDDLVGFSLADNGLFGRSVANIGDLNRDGINEIAIGASMEIGSDRGTVYILEISRAGSVQGTTKIDHASLSGKATIREGEVFGAAVAGIGDIDGDLIPDMAVGSSGDAPGSGNDRYGAVHIMLMNTDGTVKGASEIDRDNIGSSLGTGAEFGRAVAGIGDIDGDLIPDIVVGSPAGGGKDAVYVISLTPQGGFKNIIGKVDNSSNPGILPNRYDSQFGIAVAGVGDLNGDGAGDIMVGMNADGLGRGATYYIPLNPDGGAGAAVKLNDASTNGPNLAELDHFGTSVASMGDINRDGMPDVAVGAWQVLNSQGGTVHMVMTDGLLAASSDMAHVYKSFGHKHSGSLDRYGDIVTVAASAGDIDGDGTPEIIVGSPNYARTGDWEFQKYRTHGLADILFMHKNGTIKNTKTIQYDSHPDLGNIRWLDGKFGASVAGIGDINRDGIPDLAIGLPVERDEKKDQEKRALVGRTSYGYLYLLLMNATGGISDVVKIGGHEYKTLALDRGEQFGSSVSAIGDLDGDGMQDIIVGSRGKNAGSGAVYVLFLGGNDGTAIKRAAVIDANTTGGPLHGSMRYGFGSSVAGIGDINHDGIPDIAVGAVGGHKAYVVFLNADGTPKKTAEITPQPSRSFKYGSSVAGMGDLNGDGTNDIIVGAPSEKNNRRTTGAFFVHFMEPSGSVLSTTKFAPEYKQNPLGFGASMADLGDLDGDGTRDIVVGGEGSVVDVYGQEGQGVIGQRYVRGDVSIVSFANTIVSNRVTTDSSDGNYNTGNVDIDIHFSGPVQTSKARNISLSMQGLAGVASYLNSPAPDVLRFRYAIQEGDATSDLEYASATPLRLDNDAAITSGVPPHADSVSLVLPTPGIFVESVPPKMLGSLGTTHEITIDTVPPVMTIVSPANNTHVDAGASVMFEVSARDNISDDISDRISWRLSNGTLLETGPTIMQSFAGIGERFITASVSDDTGNSAEVLIRIVIDDAGVPVVVQGGANMDLRNTQSLLEVRFDRAIDASPISNVNASRFYIHPHGDAAANRVMLEGAPVTRSEDGAAIAFAMTEEQRTAILGIASPRLGIDAGAVRSQQGVQNPAATGIEITTTPDTIPPVITYATIDVRPESKSLVMRADETISISSVDLDRITITDGSASVNMSGADVTTASDGTVIIVTPTQKQASDAAALDTSAGLVLAVANGALYDISGIPTAASDIQLQVVDDTARPIAVSGLVNAHPNVRMLIVSFDKDMDYALTDPEKIQIAVRGAGTNAVEIAGASSVAQEDVGGAADRAYIRLTQSQAASVAALAAGGSALALEIEQGAFGGVSGLAVAQAEIHIDVYDDGSAPSIISGLVSAFRNAGSVSLDFDEVVTASEIDLGKIVISDLSASSNMVSLAGASVSGERRVHSENGGNIITIDMTAHQAGTVESFGNFTHVIVTYEKGTFSDQSLNPNEAGSITLDKISRTTAPKITGADIDSTGTISFVFDMPMYPRATDIGRISMFNNTGGLVPLLDGATLASSGGRHISITLLPETLDSVAGLGHGPSLRADAGAFLSEHRKVTPQSEGLLGSCFAFSLFCTEPDAPAFVSGKMTRADEGTPVQHRIIINGLAKSFHIDSHDTDAHCTKGDASCPSPMVNDTGHLIWVPSESQGRPGTTYEINVTATNLADAAITQSLGVTVNEVNEAPVIHDIESQTTYDHTLQQVTMPHFVAVQGQSISFGINATDADIPANTLAYSYNGTVGAINASTGLFEWDTQMSDASSEPYYLNFTVYDGKHHTSTVASVMVSAVQDNDAPVISLNGAPTVTIIQGDAYEDAGAACTDATDGTITPVVGGDISGIGATSEPGTYAITYDCTDTSGNSASQTTRTVTVAGPPGAPTSLTASPGTSHVILAWTAPADDGGTPVTDYIIEFVQKDQAAWSVFADGISDATFANVTGLATGQTYEFRVYASNAAGNSSTPSANVTATPDMLVTIDSAPPVITVSDILPVEAAGLMTDVIISLPEVTDNMDPPELIILTTNITGSWVQATAGFSEAFAVGNNSIYWRATDSSGNHNTASQVVIVRDTIPPSITLNGQRIMTLEVGDTYVEPNAVCTDAVDPAKNATVGAKSPVDTTAHGTHTISYTCQDAAGNRAEPVMRTVIVVGTPDPPTNLAAIHGSAQVYLEWMAPADDRGSSITGYIIEYKNSSGAWGQFDDHNTNATTFAVTGLENDNPYEFRVYAVNDAGRSAPSSVITETPHPAPGAPAGLAASPTASGVALSWNIPADDGGDIITDYIIEYRINGGIWGQLEDYTTNATTFTVTGLTNGQEYEFRVYAVNDAGRGIPSDAVSATPRGVPGAPTGLAGGHGDSLTHLRWTAPTDDGGARITDYVIEYSTSGSSWMQFEDGTSNATTFTVTGLENDRPYEFRVYAVNDAGRSAPSSVITETPHPAPGAPAGLAVSPTASGVALSWNIPADDGGDIITDYIIEYRINGGIWGQLEDYTTNATTFTVTGLTNGQEYEFRVYAVNDAGRGMPSDAISSTPLGVPGAPTGLEARADGSGVQLRWIAPADTGGAAHIIDYVTEYSTDGRSWSVFADGISNLTSAAITGLEDGQTYWFRVSAVTDAGRGDASDVSSATPRNVPGEPMELVTAYGSSQVRLEWSAPAAAGNTDVTKITDYIIEYKESGSTLWLQFEDGTSNATTTTVTNLTNGQAYEFRVYAVNDAGRSAPSGTVTGTPHPVPGAPTNLAATPAGSSVMLRWEAPAEGSESARITDYVIEYRSSAAGIGSNPGWTTHDADGGAHDTATSDTITGLTNGQAYEFRIYAVNDAGRGIPSDAISSTPRGAPGAPTELATTYGRSQVHLEWVAPADNGGDDISDYEIEYRISAGQQWLQFEDGTSNATTSTVTNLTNGQAYEFRVYAVNDAGRGAPSGIVTGTPHPVPGAPTGLAATPAGYSVLLSWTAPAADGSSSSSAPTRITDYVIEYRSSAAGIGSNPGWTTHDADGGAHDTATSDTITGLTNGQAYEFRVYAVNDAGRGIPSDAISATPRISPSPPTNLAASPAGSSVLLSWAAPADDGGAHINDYIIEYKNSGVNQWQQFADRKTDTAAATVTGLTNGQAYEFRVYAVNDAGRSAPSGIVTETPHPVPGAPTNLAATPAGSSVALGWNEPADDAGSGIIDYIIEYRSGDKTAESAGVSSEWTTYYDQVKSVSTFVIVTGLENGQEYEFRVYAVNDAGRGIPSDVASAAPRDAPGAPEGLVAIHGSSQVRLEWSAPADDGGDAIADYDIEYRVASTVRGQWVQFADGASDAGSATVTGLENGQAYEFRVYAVNDAGRGMPSDVVSEIPHPVPGIPVNLAASPSGSSVMLSWVAPADDGGEDISDYVAEYRTGPGGEWVQFADGASDATFVTVTGLENGQEYEFRVYAVNDAGRGIPSDVASAAPRDAPGAPEGLVAIHGSSQVRLEWSAPADDGGDAIADYDIEYRVASTVRGQWVQFADGASDAGSATVTGLENGQAYEFRVYAVNDAGRGMPSDVVSEIPHPVPGIPVNLAASPSGSSVMLSWVAPADDGGEDISDYVAEYRTGPGGEWVQFADGASDATFVTVTGLENGQEYEFRVYAVNDAGRGIPSDVASAAPRDAPGAPEGLVAIHGSSQVRLEWSAPADDGGDAIADYDIEYRVASTVRGQWVQFADGASDAGSATVTGLENGQAYEFRVYAVNDAGRGMPSDVVSEIPHPVPGAPTNIAAASADSGVRLNWEPPSYDGGHEIERYVVQYRAYGTSQWDMHEGDVDTTFVAITSLHNGQAYEFRVYAENDAGRSAASHTAVATPSMHAGPDTTPPIIRVATISPITSDAHSASVVIRIPRVSDDIDSASDVIIATNITGQWQVVTTDFETTLPIGIHVIHWRAADMSGNTNTATQQVTVTEDVTKPVIRLNGAQYVTILAGTAYEEHGATCSDSKGAGIDVSILGDVPVDTTVPGTYLIYYDCTDDSNNRTQQAVRTVTVVGSDTVDPSPVDPPQVDPPHVEPDDTGAMQRCR